MLPAPRAREPFRAVRRTLHVLCAAALLVAAAAPASAQEGDSEAKIFVTFAGLDSGSVNEDGAEWIEMRSLEWGSAGDTVQIGRRCAGYRLGGTVVGRLTLTRSRDGSPPDFQRACAEGKHFARMVAELATGRSEGGRYARHELRDVMVTSYRVDASSPFPMESISFDYVGAESRVIPATQRGKLDPDWDPETGEH